MKLYNLNIFIKNNAIPYTYKVEYLKKFIKESNLKPQPTTFYRADKMIYFHPQIHKAPLQPQVNMAYLCLKLLKFTQFWDRWYNIPLYTKFIDNEFYVELDSWWWKVKKGMKYMKNLVALYNKLLKQQYISYDRYQMVMRFIESNYENTRK